MSACRDNARIVAQTEIAGGSPLLHKARFQFCRGAQGLQHDAVALGQLQQALPSVLRFVGVENKAQPNFAETDRGAALDA